MCHRISAYTSVQDGCIIYFISLHREPDLQQNKCCNKIKQNVYFTALFISMQVWFNVQ